jgi:hypothetical protein
MTATVYPETMGVSLEDMDVVFGEGRRLVNVLRLNASEMWTRQRNGWTTTPRGRLS